MWAGRVGEIGGKGQKTQVVGLVAVFPSPFLSGSFQGFRYCCGLFLFPLWPTWENFKPRNKSQSRTFYFSLQFIREKERENSSGSPLNPLEFCCLGRRWRQGGRYSDCLPLCTSVIRTSLPLEVASKSSIGSRVANSYIVQLLAGGEIESWCFLLRHLPRVLSS